MIWLYQIGFLKAACGTLLLEWLPPGRLERILGTRDHLTAVSDLRELVTLHVALNFTVRMILGNMQHCPVQ